jgi:nucleoside-diphosphate-sugar epimerase
LKFTRHDVILLPYLKKLASDFGVTFVASAVGMLLGFPVSVIYWDGKQSRDFTLAKNIVDANILSSESDKTGIFNFVCGRRIAINQLVDYISKIMI